VRRYLSPETYADRTVGGQMPNGLRFAVGQRPIKMDLLRPMPPQPDSFKRRLDLRLLV
jgi:hypothetical protein